MPPSPSFYPLTRTRGRCLLSATGGQRNERDLVALYRQGRGAYDAFHEFLATAATASPTAYCLLTPDDEHPGMKGIYRALEKGMLKYNGGHGDALDFSRMFDLVRGAIVDMTMDGLATVVEHMLRSDAITVCRVKDRFSEPSAAGWSDCMVNLQLNSDAGGCVCEVQLIHFKMLSQRVTQEGHGAYNVFRVGEVSLCVCVCVCVSRGIMWYVCVCVCVCVCPEA